MVKPRVKVPESAAAGEIIIIKTLLSHPMHSGHRKDAQGILIARRIINRFTCAFNDQLVFSCEPGPSVAANPYLEFAFRVERPGTFRFTWRDDDGTLTSLEQALQLR